MYENLFKECGITDKKIQNDLVSFVEKCDNNQDSEFINKLNTDKKMQIFVEKAFALKFKPLQDLFGNEN